jgi:hypothetical protein
MNADDKLKAMRDLIQEDVGNRGLRRDATDNLISAFPNDFADACRSLANTPQAKIMIVTGFYIPHAEPPGGETDGPLGAVFLARALVPLGVEVVLATDRFCARALEVGVKECGLAGAVSVRSLPSSADPLAWGDFHGLEGRVTHLIALERVGPSHTRESLLAQRCDGRPKEMAAFEREVPETHQDRCHTMGGLDITANMGPAHLLFETAMRGKPSVATIGIGDGGNEIGMGKMPWEVIRKNIPNGGLVACRVPTHALIVAGVSNWGAYALAAGVTALRGKRPDSGLFDVAREKELLSVMVREGPLVDGVSGKPTVTVDGLAFAQYANPLERLRALMEST